jgi:hypothetical protein
MKFEYLNKRLGASVCRRSAIAIQSEVFILMQVRPLQPGPWLHPDSCFLIPDLLLRRHEALQLFKPVLHQDHLRRRQIRRRFLVERE